MKEPNGASRETEDGANAKLKYKSYYRYIIFCENCPYPKWPKGEAYIKKIFSILQFFWKDGKVYAKNTPCRTGGGQAGGGGGRIRHIGTGVSAFAQFCRKNERGKIS